MERSSKLAEFLETRIQGATNLGISLPRVSCTGES